MRLRSSIKLCDAQRCEKGPDRHLFVEEKGGEMSFQGRFMGSEFVIRDYDDWLEEVGALSFEGETKEFMEQYRERCKIRELDDADADKRKSLCFGSIAEFRKELDTAWVPRLPRTPPIFLRRVEDVEKEDEEEEEVVVVEEERMQMRRRRCGRKGG